MKNPWMPLYIADYLADTTHLSAAQHGAYLLLIMHYWRQGGLPKTDAELAKIVRMDRHEWGRSRKIIAAFFDENWHHARIENELSHAQVVSRVRQETGARGGRAKALKDKEAALANATDLPPSLPPHLPDVRHSKPPSKPPSKKVHLSHTIPNGIVHSPLPNGKGKNGAHSEPPGSGAVAPSVIISVPEAKADADKSAYFKRGRQILGNGHDVGRVLAAVLKNNNGNLNAARLAMEQAANAVSPVIYAHRLANGPPKRDDDEEARRERGDRF